MKKIRIKVTQEHYERALAYERVNYRGALSPHGCLIAQALQGAGISFKGVGYKTVVFHNNAMTFLSERVIKIISEFESNNHFIFKPFHFYLEVPLCVQTKIDYAN